MLSDREKMILHFCCAVTIAKMNDMADHNAIIEEMVEGIRRNRCRSLTIEDVADLVDEINDEMIVGSNMFKYLIEETTWSMTGERPNKNTDWSDMR